jgi:hypothetical protein
MRASSIEVLCELAKQVPQVPCIQGNQVIEAFSANGSYQPLAVGIGLRSAYWRS